MEDDDDASESFVSDGGEKKRRLDNDASASISQQELRELSIIVKKKEAQHCQFQHMLKSLMADPPKFKRLEFRYLREFVSHIQKNRDAFPEVMGDKTNGPIEPVENIGALEKGGDEEHFNRKKAVLPTNEFIKAIAENRAFEAELFENSILQVVEREKKYREPAFDGTAFKNGKNRNSQAPVQMTHLRLRDGDNNTMLGRIVIHETHEAKKLQPGDIIQLSLFTPLLHRVVSEGHQKPAVFIVKYSRVNYLALPDKINDPLICECGVGHPTPVEKKQVIKCSGNLQKDVSDANCTYANRLCSKHGVSMVACICGYHPVQNLDLHTIKED